MQDAALQPLLAPYAGPKGNLQFPLSEPLPLALIARVVQARIQENQARQAARPSRRVGAARRLHSDADGGGIARAIAKHNAIWIPSFNF